MLELGLGAQKWMVVSWSMVMVWDERSAEERVRRRRAQYRVSGLK